MNKTRRFASALLAAALIGSPIATATAAPTAAVTAQASGSALATYKVQGTDTRTVTVRGGLIVRAANNAAVTVTGPANTRGSGTVTVKGAGKYTVTVKSGYATTSLYDTAPKVSHQMPTGVDYPLSPGGALTSDLSKAPTAAGSAEMVTDLNRQVKKYYGQVGFNVNKFNAAWVVVGKDQPRADVRFWDCQKKGYTPSVLKKHFAQVPVPADAVPAAGTDAQLAVWSPETNQLWDFWKMRLAADGVWEACWGGRLDNVSQSKQHVFPDLTGASASSIITPAASIGINEVRAGRIDHALYMVMPEAKAGWKNFVWPATRTDGRGTQANAIPEGSRLVLDPTFNVAGSNLHPIAKMAAEAAQKYGIVVADTAGAVAITAESGAGVQAQTGVDPWRELMTKPGATTPTASYDVFKGFPWSKLRVVEPTYGK